MRPSDQRRFAEFIAEFLDSTGIEPPFYLVCIDANGSVRVSYHFDSSIEEVCASEDLAEEEPVTALDRLSGGLVPPLVLAVIAPDGRGRSAKIEIVEAGRLRMM